MTTAQQCVLDAAIDNQLPWQAALVERATFLMNYVECRMRRSIKRKRPLSLREMKNLDADLNNALYLLAYMMTRQERPFSK